MAKTDLAIERAQRAIKLSPFDVMLFGPYTALAAAHVIAGRPQEVRAAARAPCDPDQSALHAVACVWLAIALVVANDLEGAKAAGRKLLEIEPGFTTSGFAALAPKDGRQFVVAALQKAGLPP